MSRGGVRSRGAPEASAARQPEGRDPAGAPCDAAVRLIAEDRGDPARAVRPEETDVGFESFFNPFGRRRGGLLTATFESGGTWNTEPSGGPVSASVADPAELGAVDMRASPGDTGGPTPLWPGTLASAGLDAPGVPAASRRVPCTTYWQGKATGRFAVPDAPDRAWRRDRQPGLLGLLQDVRAPPWTCARETTVDQLARAIPAPAERPRTPRAARLAALPLPPLPSPSAS